VTATPPPAPPAATAAPGPLAARRPPAPTRGAGSVTRLVSAGDERETVPVAAVEVEGSLALAPCPARAPDPLPDLAPTLRLVEDDSRPDDREVQAWAARFAQATVEVLGGDRPLPQLLRWTTLRVYQDLDRRVRILGRAAAAPQRRQTVRAQFRSVHVCRPAAGAAEVSVHVRHGHRSRAIAARLERRHGRWTCVALELG
jgi:Family of unknown function (DUF6459)